MTRPADPLVTTIAIVTLSVVLAFWAYCLYDFTHADKTKVRSFSTQTWILLLVLTGLLGSLLWWFRGRPRPPRARHDR